MSAPVLQDLAGRDFTEGDYVVYSSVNGIRYGKVGWIKDMTHPNSAINGGQKRYKVYVNLDFHHTLDGKPGKMYAKRVGYEYVEKHFLKVNPIT